MRNKLSVFMKENQIKAINLKERFKIIETKPWNSLTVLSEVQVQLGHVASVIYGNDYILELGRKFNNLGDELSDVLLQLTYLAKLEGLDCSPANLARFEKSTASDLISFIKLTGALAEALLEKNEQRFNKAHNGFKSTGDLIEEAIFNMMVIILNIATNNKIDATKAFHDMCADANNFLDNKEREMAEGKLSALPKKSEQFPLEFLKSLEILDIFDEEHNHIGTCDKREVHRKGLWHQVFGCLFIDSKKNTVYLQCKKKEHDKTFTTNQIDISVGGHLLAGEKVEDGIREIKEESGLDIAYEEMIPVGMRKINKKMSEDYIIREFSYLHILDREFDITKLHSEDDEVEYYVSFDIDDMIEFLTTEKQTIEGFTPEGFKMFTKEDFIKGYLEDDRLYLRYLLMAKQVINKEKNISWNFH